MLPLDVDGVIRFPKVAVFAQELQDNGFVGVRFRRLSLGIVAIHVAQRPALARAAEHSGGRTVG